MANKCNGCKFQNLEVLQWKSKEVKPPEICKQCKATYKGGSNYEKKK